MGVRHLTAACAVAVAFLGPVFTAAPVEAAVYTSSGVACTIVGTAGADTLVGTSRRDVICGRGGNDTIRGRGGNDLIDGGPGADRVSAGAGNDNVIGAAGNDLIAGSVGSDTLRGGDGTDRVNGGDGTDRIDGGASNDVLSGDGAADTLTGDGGNDVIHGGDSADSLAGGDGDDELTGGPGADNLDGGAGVNACILDSEDEWVRCLYDENPPTAVETAVDITAVDVTTADAKVQVRVHATDDTEVVGIQGGLAAGNNGTSVRIGWMSLVSGTVRDGWWEGTATIPTGTPPGTLFADLWVTDRMGRSVEIDGAKVGVSVRVYDTDPDTVAPQLTLTEASPAAIDVRTQDNSVTITVHAVDPKSGVSRLDLCLGHPGTVTQFVAYPLYEGSCADAVKTSGTTRDGTWTRTITIPEGAVGATFNVLAYAEDVVGNRARWLGPDAHQQWVKGRWCCGAEYPFANDAGRVEVTGSVADTVPAWIDTVASSKAHLDTLASSDQLLVRVHALDASGEGEGVTFVGAQLVSDQSTAADPMFNSTTFTLASGTVTDGWWEGYVVAPQGTPPGTYHLLVGVSDRAHAADYTDPTGPMADGITYKPLDGIPVITVVDSRG